MRQREIKCREVRRKMGGQEKQRDRDTYVEVRRKAGEKTKRERERGEKKMGRGRYRGRVRRVGHTGRK